MRHYAQNPLDTFPRNFTIDGKVASQHATRVKLPWHWHIKMSPTSRGKRHDTTDFLPAPTCYGLATGKRKLL